MVKVEHAHDKALSATVEPGNRFGSEASTDAEKHEKPVSSVEWGGSSDDSSSGHGCGPGFARAGQPLSRSVSEVRDGIQNQRDPELARDEGPDRVDADLVQWDGPSDPENPKCWPIKRKWAAVFCVSLFTLISPMASSMVAPDLEAIGRDLDITSELKQALVLSIFVAAFALGPLLWGPLSELYGRVIIIQTSNVVFLLFNLGCGLARTGSQMIAFRFLAGIGGSAPLAIGGGLLSDLFAAEERGRAISVYSLMPLLGPAVGPIAGGWIAERTSWRWVFYSTTIACGVIQAAGLLFLQETYAPVLLHRKKRLLMKETGNAALRTEYDDDDEGGGGSHRTLARTLAVALTRPFRLLATQPIVQMLSLYMMYLYGMLYLVLSTFPALWATKYHESTGIQGLNYISLGIGFFLGAQVCAPLQDRIYVALKRRYVPDGGPGRPEFRVPMMVPGAVLVPAGLLIYSWTAEAGTHWIGPNVGAALYAAGTIIGFQCVQGYIVDSYTRYAASAVGAITVLRSLAGFGFPLFAPAMYAALGYGRGGTVLAACAVAVGWPSPLLLWVYGARLRAKSKFSA
ncbi:major facilitator superfamily protein [Hirsutella rhossiliensis]|uniref:Major facilitator superfamily domain-containing protein n=1 Tax=Hirsutella rhossiliensis TaxID=111463 RepID=A0A9P8N223_9HYPO|nr:major facilitator superfamily domain-containing protein [Hirsutella rhossiliensis]KAH0964496.1 major facilitator superfamily domain-containing protein [Hirsutella rhossiliensis]